MAKLFNYYQLQRYLKLFKSFNTNPFRSYKTELGDNVTELRENTLTGRLLIYLNNFNVSNIQNKSLKPKRINPLTDDLKSCNIAQIKASLKYLGTSQSISDLDSLQEIDQECTRRVKQMKTADIYEILHILMEKVPNRIIKYKFYEHSIRELSTRLKFFNKNDLIQYIFYIGLRKKFTRHHNKIRECLCFLSKSNLNTLTVEDICVVCNSTFKTTTRINNEAFLSNVIMYLYNNLQLFKDSAFLITFLKSIRHNRYQDEDLLATMSSTIFFNKTLNNYSFSAMCHILAVYSDYLYYDENLLRVFTERCIFILKNSCFINKAEHMSVHSRLKDIKRFLWCLSNLNYNGLKTSDIKYVIIPNILQRVKAGDVEDNFSSVIEITLYLWMLNYRAYELMPYFLKNDVIQVINELKTPVKQRLNLLLTCIFYEDKELFKKIGIYPKPNTEYDMTRQFEKRPLLQKVIHNLKDISKNHELNRFEVNCQVPGINIVGVTGYKRKVYKTVYIEVLDEYTTLKNTEHLPTGPMQLKLRLLDHLQEAVILVDSDEIGTMNDNEMQEMLLDEIEFVC